MREILFRGKTAKGEWIYGFYMNEGVKDIIVDTTRGSLGFGLEVDGETVGQYTGLCDKNGTKIFEGDILAEQICGENRILGVVKYGEGTFDSGIYCYTGFFYEHPANGRHDHTNIAQSDLLEDSVVVDIGNITDNPELLEVEQ